MIAAPTPANCNFTELQHRPIERAKASKGEALVGHVTIADGSAKSVLRGVAGSLARSWRAPIAFATFRAWPCGGKLAIHERYRMARAVHVGHNRQLCFQRVGPPIFSEADQVGKNTAPYPSKVPGCWIRSHLFWEAAVFALVPLFTLSELREGDRHPKVNAPLGCDWRILVISHPLCRNIKVQWRQTGTNHHSADSQT
jgi:hypothetical protein